MGAPGVGKTLLAKAAQSLLPPLNASEVPTVLKTYSVYPHEKRSPWERPFRAPHHSVSPAGLLGGGKGIVSPGEVTLAHLGVLFLDEFPEFRRDAIEGLREPLQNGNIRVQRIGAGAPFPALFTLIAAMNPCPCGYALSSKKLCYCTREQKNRYQRKISGPIVERIDLYVSLNFVGQEASDITLSKQEQVIKRMEKAFARQLTRYKDPFLRNGDANRELYNDAFQLGEAETLWWQNQAVPNARNHRMLDKLIRVARTIADLDDQERILVCHLQEAWLFRCAPQQISGWH